MPPLGRSHALLDAEPKTKQFIRLFGVNDLHSHYRWNAARRFIDFDAERTLEVGANSGVMTFELAPKMRGKIVASEFDPKAVALAEQIKAAEGHDNVTFGQADLRELAADPGAFDQALVIDVLEHIDDHETAARQLAAALRPGGRLVVSVPTPNYPKVFGRAFHESIGHVRDGYWLEDLRALLEPAGFKIRDHRYYTGRVASFGCSLHYRRGLGYKATLLSMPPLRAAGMIGERFVKRDNAASVAVIAVRQ